MMSMSFSLSLLADAMAFSVHDALHMTHESQPALKSYIKVDDQLRAFSVTLSPLQRIFRSNQLLAMPSSYQMPRLDSVHRHHVILELAAVNDFTNLHTYLRDTATHDKKISQFFDVADAEPASTFCTFHSMCLGRLSAEPTGSSAPSTRPSLSTMRLADTPNTSSALHCHNLLSAITVLDHIIVSGPWHLNKLCLVLMAARTFVEAVLNSVVGPAELLYNHLVMVCFTVTLYADNRLVYTNLSQKFNPKEMKLCEGRNKAADLSTMPKVNTAEEALLCTAAVDAPLKQLPQGTTQDDISPLPKRTQYEYKAQMAQAIGHVRRPGQEKLVQVYRIVALDTIDVDILEHREHRTTVMAEYKHSDVEKKRSPGTDFEDKLKPELIKPQKTELIRDVNGEVEARDAVSAKEEQIKTLEQEVVHLKQSIQKKISLTDHGARIAKLNVDKAAMIDNLADTNKRGAMLVDQIKSKRAGQPDNTAVLLERNEALENAKKLQSRLTASEEKIKKLEAHAQQPIIVNTAFISQPVANSTAWGNPATPTLSGVGVVGLSWVGFWLGWEVEAGGEDPGGTGGVERWRKDRGSEKNPGGKASGWRIKEWLKE
ncbi:hypothetical protein KCU64_g567, partial [Aureobasidium melanogenum]